MRKNRHPSNEAGQDAHTPEDVVIDNVTVEDSATKDVDAVDTTTESDACDDLADLSPEERLQSLQDKIASLEDAVLRGQAEAQNIQRRGIQQRQEAITFANADLMKSMLSVVDDFQRALEAASKSDDISSVVDGIKLVYENFMKAMTVAGLAPIVALDQPFDPHIHEALLQQPSEKHEPGMVIEEINKGFTLHGRTLRPARVIVSKAMDEPSSKTSVTGE